MGDWAELASNLIQETMNQAAGTNQHVRHAPMIFQSRIEYNGHFPSIFYSC